MTTILDRLLFGIAAKPSKNQLKRESAYATLGPAHFEGIANHREKAKARFRHRALVRAEIAARVAYNAGKPAHLHMATTAKKIVCQMRHNRFPGHRILTAGQ